MHSTDNKRIKLLVNWLISQGVFSSQQELGEKFGITSKSYLSQLVNGKAYSQDFINKLSDFDPRINRKWLESGVGEMINPGYAANQSSTGVNESSARQVSLLPVSAQGGSLNDFAASVNERDCEKVVSPIKDVDFAMTVSGDSMAPEYPNGSHIFIKKINEKAFIEWGKVYVLDTCNGTVIKVLVPSDKEGYVRCRSINPDTAYAPFDVSLNDVYGIYRVLLCMSVK